jgi:ketosteroid isomerase-like protein
MMGPSRDEAVAFVEGYGRTWEGWDFAAWLDLFTDDVVYIEHPTQQPVVGRAALEAYVRKEAAEQGSVSVRVGLPVVEGDRVAGEFWVTSTEASEPMTLVGGFIARLEPDGRCSHFREYWFYVEGEATPPYKGWGE